MTVLIVARSRGGLLREALRVLPGGVRIRLGMVLAYLRRPGVAEFDTRVV